MNTRHSSAFHAGSFQAAARPFFAGTEGRHARGAFGCPAVASAAAYAAADGPSKSGRAEAGLAELTEGPYLVIASQLDSGSLCRADAACRQLRSLNRASSGPWRALGARAFGGLELEGEGFDVEGGRKRLCMDWKGRCRRFSSEVPAFRPPFGGASITQVRHADEVAYCRCRLRSDLAPGVYLEVEVVANPDNLSLAVVDFEAGGRSSVTFSPDTGAVIRERKVQEAPRRVEGSYIHPLPATPLGQRFEGCVGVYLRSGSLAFFRRCAFSGEDVLRKGAWECTGFIADLNWVEGRLTPCIAFRDEGDYHVRISHVGPDPPQEPCKAKACAAAWSSLDWEAGPAVEN